MITPIFSLKQDERYVFVNIKAPMAKISETEVEIHDQQMTFYAAPYFLRLKFESPIVDDCSENAQVTYEADACSYAVQITKSNKGQYFNDLDMLTKLLVKPKRATHARKLVEVIGQTVNNDDKNNDGEASHDGDDDNDVTTELSHEQTLWTEEDDQKLCLSSQKYGFYNQSSGIFERLQEDIRLVVDIQEPDKKTFKTRRQERINNETHQFSEDHYLFDLYENERVILDVIRHETSFNKIFSHVHEQQQLVDRSTQDLSLNNLDKQDSLSIKMSNIVINDNHHDHDGNDETKQVPSKGTTNCDCATSCDNVSNHDKLNLETKQTPADSNELIQLSQDAIYRLMNFNNVSYIPDERLKQQALLSMLDILYAYCYDLRTTEEEHSSESGWTIIKLSPTLNWFDCFGSIEEVVIDCIRRSLIYPLYRHWKLSLKIWQDVYEILNLGKKAILKCYLDLHRILNDSGGEYHYILNDLYITDYCVWIQNIKIEDIKSLKEDLEKVINSSGEREESSLITKGKMKLDIEELEEAAEIVLAEEGLNKK